MKDGFTLVETVIYLGVIALVAVSLSSFAITVASSRGQTQERAEIQASARTALEIIADKIRSADNVDVISGILYINPGPSQTLICLDVSGRVAVGCGGTPVFITSTGVRISRLFFENRTLGRRKNIYIEIIAEQKDASALPGYSYELATSVSVRSDQ